jgi:ribonuclease HI
MNSDVTIFSDGSCLGNPGPGGWAALLRTVSNTQNIEKLLVGGAKDTTNNRMELQAALEGLLALKHPCRVEIVTDSNYLVKGMTEWIQGWQKRDWKNSKKKPVENRDLWESLLNASRPHDIRWTWVKGHAGHAENERVDQAAHAEASRQKDSIASGLDG